jgi:hypothetical protein
MIMASQSQRIQRDSPPDDEPPPSGTQPTLPKPGGAVRGWTVGRIIAVVTGSLLLLFSLGVLGAGALLVWADQTQRTDGYLPISQGTYSTAGYALVSERIALHSGWEYLEPLLGEVRIQVSSPHRVKPVFIGVAKASQAAHLLASTGYMVISRSGVIASHQGRVAPGAPDAAWIWSVQVLGPSPQTLTWTPDTGDWTVVVMNADGSASLTAHLNVTISAPMLLPAAVEIVVSGVLLGVFAAALVWIPVRLAAGDNTR